MQCHSISRVLIAAVALEDRVVRGGEEMTVTGKHKIVAAALAASALAFAAAAEPSISYKNPTTGRDCVEELTTRPALSDDYVEVVFHNSCSRRFSLHYILANGQKGGTGIAGNSDSYFTLRRADLSGMRWSFD